MSREAPTVGLLRDLVEIESPTYACGVQKVAERVAGELVELGGEVRIFDGGHLRAEFPGQGAPVLLIGHTDTVWPEGTLDSMPFRIADGRAHGPGVWDMKGGLVVMIDAIARARSPRAIRVFLSADEERSSLTAREHIADVAQGAAVAFVLEPPTEAGAVKSARKAVGRFTVRISGLAAHSGTNLHDGVSANEELGHLILFLQSLTGIRPGLTVNVGVVRGGAAANVVAAEAEALIDVRARTADDQRAFEIALADREDVVAGIGPVTIEGGWTKPPLEPTTASRRLLDRAREHAAALGQELPDEETGGASDGNLIAALGVPVLDGLGPKGRGAHAEHECVELASMGPQADLLARLLCDATI